MLKRNIYSSYRGLSFINLWIITILLCITPINNLWAQDLDEEDELQEFFGDDEEFFEDEEEFLDEDEFLDEEEFEGGDKANDFNEIMPRKNYLFQI